MKQSDKVQDMNHQRKICAFQEYHGYEQKQNQWDTIYQFIFVEKGFYCFNLRSEASRCSEALRFKVGSLLSFSDFDESETISGIALW